MENEIVPNPEIQPTGEENQEAPKLSYEDLQNELKKVRQEAASRRITNRELEEKAKRWEEYEDSQKTELQKLQEALAAKDKELSSYQLEKTKMGLIDEFELDKDDLDLLTGSDEASNRVIAEKLKAKNEKIKNANVSSSRPADLLAGNRGTPVGGNDTPHNFDDTLRKLLQGR